LFGLPALFFRRFGEDGCWIGSRTVQEQLPDQPVCFGLEIGVRSGLCDIGDEAQHIGVDVRCDGHERSRNVLRRFKDLLRHFILRVGTGYRPDIAKSQSETKAENEFALTFDSINKIAFSRSSDGAEGRNTKIVRSNLRDEILKLKQEQGKGILVAV